MKLHYLEPGSQGFPESVVDMMSGGLGWPDGGWPKDVQRIVLGEKRAAEARKNFKKNIVPGAVVTPANLGKVRKELSEMLKRQATNDDVFSHLMYPKVFADFIKHLREFRPRSRPACVKASPGPPTPCFDPIWANAIANFYRHGATSNVLFQSSRAQPRTISHPIP